MCTQGAEIVYTMGAPRRKERHTKPPFQWKFFLTKAINLWWLNAGTHSRVLLVPTQRSISDRIFFKKNLEYNPAFA